MTFPNDAYTAPNKLKQAVSWVPLQQAKNKVGCGYTDEVYFPGITKRCISRF
ncbi:MAG TPA: hypothetical protein VIF10_16510 [Methylobacter sp.]|jgi:hypothetical protein